MKNLLIFFDFQEPLSWLIQLYKSEVVWDKYYFKCLHQVVHILVFQVFLNLLIFRSFLKTKKYW